MRAALGTWSCTSVAELRRPGHFASHPAHAGQSFYLTRLRDQLQPVESHTAFALFVVMHKTDAVAFNP
jgi:hypothetical protein